MILVGINAKYIHSNLAIRYLSRLDSRCSFMEFSVSDMAEHIASALFETGEKEFLFSCYIWNIECVRKVCEILKKADSNLRLGVGGPEVSFDGAEGLLENPDWDFILRGEGETSISPFLDSLSSGNFSQVPGLVYRMGEKLLFSDLPPKEADFSEIPFPYTEADIASLSNRIVYYETSRGCPYRCTFCLSGGAGSLRFMPVERVKRELDFFITHKLPLVKLVDRTFNADAERALEIIEYIKASGGATTFHFEIRAETMTSALIESLQAAPKGMFQLEIGVQSVNPKTLTAISRNPDFPRLRAVVLALKKKDNIHLHLDLIAGLSGETLPEFIHSFQSVLSLRPHALQLGFLKKLRGAPLTDGGSRFSSFPPYEVITSDAMSYQELLELKGVEDALEKYYNSGVFYHSLNYLLDTYYADRSYIFFLEMSKLLKKEGTVSQKRLYELLYTFCMERFRDDSITKRIIYDYALLHRDSLSFMKQETDLKERAFAFLKQEDRRGIYFPEYVGEKPVVLYKKLRFLQIGSRIFAFDTGKKRGVDVTEDFPIG